MSQWESIEQKKPYCLVEKKMPMYQEWDDWPLCVTFRVNSFLRADGASPEPDLDILNSF